jgi:hypothetical protein
MTTGTAWFSNASGKARSASVITFLCGAPDMAKLTQGITAKVDWISEALTAVAPTLRPRRWCKRARAEHCHQPLEDCVHVVGEDRQNLVLQRARDGGQCLVVVGAGSTVPLRATDSRRSILRSGNSSSANG